MSGEQILVLILLAAAFAAGWFARGGDEEAPRKRPASPPPPPPAGTPLERAVRAYQAAMSMWLREGARITSAGRTTLEVLDRRVDELGEIEPGTPEEALDIAAARLDAYRRGRALDAATLHELEQLEAVFGEFVDEED